MRRIIALVVIFTLALVSVALAAHHHRRHTWQHTTASWFGHEGEHGCAQHKGVLGVAHKTLPCGSHVRVCTGRAHAWRCATLMVEDRGPYIGGRDLDLYPESKAALGCSDLCPVGWHPGRR